MKLEVPLLLLQFVYIANIFVCAWISSTCLFAPATARTTIFENTVAYSETIRLVGALWGAIFVLSVLGLFFPRQMALVLVFQLIYKSTWLLVVALPAQLNGEDFPRGMAMTFLIWVIGLPFVIPWRSIFAANG